VQKNATSLAY